MVSHTERKPKVINAEEYTRFCQKNETEYINTFIQYLF